MNVVADPAPFTLKDGQAYTPCVVACCLGCGDPVTIWAWHRWLMWTPEAREKHIPALIDSHRCEVTS